MSKERISIGRIKQVVDSYRGQVVTNVQVADALGISRPKASSGLSRAHDKGMIERVSIGVYRAVLEGAPRQPVIKVENRRLRDDLRVVRDLIDDILKEG